MDIKGGSSSCLCRVSEDFFLRPSLKIDRFGYMVERERKEKENGETVGGICRSEGDFRLCSGFVRK